MQLMKDAWGSNQYENDQQAGFSIGSPSLIDIRLVLTKAQMLNLDDAYMPPKYFALCSDNNRIYYYDKRAKFVNKQEIPRDDSRVGKFTALCLNVSSFEEEGTGRSLVTYDPESDSYKVKIHVAHTETNQLKNSGDRDKTGTKFVTVKMDRAVNPNNDTDIFELIGGYFNRETKSYSIKDIKKIAFTGNFDDLSGFHVDADEVIYRKHKPGNHDNSRPIDFYKHVLENFPERIPHGNEDITVDDALGAVVEVFTKEDTCPLYINDVKATKVKDEPIHGTGIKDSIGTVRFKLTMDDIIGHDEYTTKSGISDDIRRVISEDGIDYNSTYNKPTLNGNELVGDLDIDNDIMSQSSVVTDLSHRMSSVESSLETKQTKLVPSDNTIKLVDEGDHVSISAVVDTLTDYNKLDNKPSINGVQLAGDKSLTDLGLDLTSYAKTSDVNQALDLKQNKLVQGKGINLRGNEISANLDQVLLGQAPISTVNKPEGLEVKLNYTNKFKTLGNQLDLKLSDSTLKSSDSGLGVNIDNDTIKVGSDGLYTDAITKVDGFGVVEVINSKVPMVRLNYEVGDFNGNNGTLSIKDKYVSGFEFKQGTGYSAVIEDHIAKLTVPTPTGPGGTTNYNDLSNKPQINGVTIQDNKTLEDYGLDLSGYATSGDLELKQDKISVSSPLKIENNVIDLSYDNKTITSNAGKLCVPIDNSSLVIRGGKLCVDLSTLIDNDTITINSDGKLCVSGITYHS